MSASVNLFQCGTLFWLYAQAVTTDINNILCQHTCLLWHLYWIWQENWKLHLQYFCWYILGFNKGSDLVQSQCEHCLLHWAENAANRAGGTDLPRLHLSESTLLCKSYSYWVDSFLAIMFTAWIKIEFLSWYFKNLFTVFLKSGFVGYFYFPLQT